MDRLRVIIIVILIFSINYIVSGKSLKDDIFSESMNWASAPMMSFMDCTGPTTVSITCGSIYDDTTADGPSWANSYNCWSYNMTGPEKVHILQLSQNAHLTVTISNTIDELDVFILSDCDTNACVFGNDFTILYPNAPAGTYYIVVDGRDGNSGYYTLTVNCEFLPTPTPTVTPTPPPIPTLSNFSLFFLIILFSLILSSITWKLTRK